MNSQSPMPDPQETTSAPSSSPDPVPVLNNAPPEPKLSRRQRANSKLILLVGVILIILGPVLLIVGCVLTYLWLGLGGSQFLPLGLLIILSGFVGVVGGNYLLRRWSSQPPKPGDDRGETVGVGDPIPVDIQEQTHTNEFVDPAGEMPSPVLNYAPPSDVLEYAPLQEPASVGEWARVIFGRIFGMCFLILGALVEIWGVILLCLTIADAWSRKHWAGDLFRLMVFMLIGIVMLWSGYRWLRVKPRSRNQKA